MKILITGASKGIGKETAKILVQEGHEVIITGTSNQTKLTAKELDCKYFISDVSSEKDQENLLKNILEVDVLILNAGLGHFSALEETSIENYDKMFDVNVKGVFLSLRNFIPKLKKQNSGQIIVISSMAGINPVPNGSIYCATKWALQGMIKSLKQEIRDYKIKVSLVLPGSVNTAFFADKGITPNPKRVLKPQSIAKNIVSLVNQPADSDIDEIIIRPSLN